MLFCWPSGSAKDSALMSKILDNITLSNVLQVRVNTKFVSETTYKVDLQL